VTEEILIPLAKAKGISKLYSGSSRHTKHTLQRQGSSSLTVILALAVRGAGTGMLPGIQSAGDLWCHEQVAQTVLQEIRILSDAATL